MSESQKQKCYIAFMVCICLLTITVIAMAETPPRERPNFAKFKQEMIERLNTELACVEAAKDDNALRACRPRPPQGGPDRSANSSQGYKPDQFSMHEFF